MLSELPFGLEMCTSWVTISLPFPSLFFVPRVSVLASVPDSHSQIWLTVFPIFAQTSKHCYCFLSAYTLSLMDRGNSRVSHCFQEPTYPSRYQDLCFQGYHHSQEDWNCTWLNEARSSRECMMGARCRLYKYIAKSWLCLPARSALNCLKQSHLLRSCCVGCCLGWDQCALFTFLLVVTWVVFV